MSKVGVGVNVYLETIIECHIFAMGLFVLGGVLIAMCIHRLKGGRKTH